MVHVRPLLSAVAIGVLASCSSQSPDPVTAVSFGERSLLLQTLNPADFIVPPASFQGQFPTALDVRFTQGTRLVTRATTVTVSVTGGTAPYFFNWTVYPCGLTTGQCDDAFANGSSPFLAVLADSGLGRSSISIPDSLYRDATSALVVVDVREAKDPNYRSGSNSRVLRRVLIPTGSGTGGCIPTRVDYIELHITGVPGGGQQKWAAYGWDRCDGKKTWRVTPPAWK